MTATISPHQMKMIPGPGIFAFLPATADRVRTVTDIAVLEDGEVLHLTLDWEVVPAPAEVQIGWLYDGKHFAEARTLSWMALKLRQAGRLFAFRR